MFYYNIAMSEQNNNTDIKPKRKRGRPRKVKIDKPKKPVGRPKKYDSDEERKQANRENRRKYKLRNAEKIREQRKEYRKRKKLEKLLLGHDFTHQTFKKL
jgi:hypothetical protein